MRLVVDASVAIKWVLEEEGVDEAHRVRARHYELMAPDLLWSELSSVLWKRYRRGQYTGKELAEMLADLSDVPMTDVPIRGLIADALDLAVRLDYSPYDCLYLALAERESCRVVTADGRLAAAAARGGLGDRILRLEDVP